MTSTSGPPIAYIREMLFWKDTATLGHAYYQAISLPLTAVRAVHRIITDLAVLDVTPAGLALRERAPGVSVEEIQSKTEPTLIVDGDVPEIVTA